MTNHTLPEAARPKTGCLFCFLEKTFTFLHKIPLFFSKKHSTLFGVSML